MNDSIQSLYNWYRNAIRNPKYRWWVILGTMAYLVSPIDIAPDFIPIVGQIDDLILVTLLVSEVSQLIIERFKTLKKASVPLDKQPGSETVDVDAVTVEKSSI